MTRFISNSNLLEMMILYQIDKEGAMHGYALANSIESKFGWKPSQTAIYNVLKSLEEQNLVTVDVSVENGRARKEYSITSIGESDLQKKRDRIEIKVIKRFIHMMLVFQESDIDTEHPESDLRKQLRKQIMKDMFLVNQLSLHLMHEDPEKISNLVDDTLHQLKKIASDCQFDIAKLPKPHKSFPFFEKCKK